MAKKIFTDESLEIFVDKIKYNINKEVSKKANTSHTHYISDITNLQTQLNNKSNSNHTHTLSELDAATLTEVKTYLGI